jgi:hypothetical protein
MNHLEGVSTKDLVHELQRRRFQGVDFWIVKPYEEYKITIGLSRDSTPRPVQESKGPAILIEVID